MPKIYIAGPLFTQGDRFLLEKIDSLCRELIYATYLPHRDAGLFTKGEGDSKFFFERDRTEIDSCDLVIAVLNGQDVDSGTAWEIGYAVAKGKRVIGFVEDTRIFKAKVQLNLMIVNSVSVIVESIAELEIELKKYQAVF